MERETIISDYLEAARAVETASAKLTAAVMADRRARQRFAQAKDALRASEREMNEPLVQLAAA